MAYFAKPQYYKEYEECFVSNCIDAGPWKFNVQFKQQRELYFNLQYKLMLYYSAGTFPVSISAGSNVLCCTEINSNKEYYRGMVLEEKGHNDTVSVYLVDKGITFKVNCQSLRALPKELIDTPMLIYRCMLEGLPPLINSTIISSFLKVVNSCSLKAKIVSLDDEKAVKISMLANGQDILKLILPPYRDGILSNNSEVFISAVFDDIIYVQLINEKLEDLQARLQVEGILQPCLLQPKVNQPCIAKFHDNCWYRAEVIEVGENIKVKYVDFGNTDLITPSNLREINSSFRCQLPSQAIPCILHQVPKTNFKAEYVYQVALVLA